MRGRDKFPWLPCSFSSLHSVSSQALTCNFCSFKHFHKVINHSNILSFGFFLSFAAAVLDFSCLCHIHLFYFLSYTAFSVITVLYFLSFSLHHIIFCFWVLDIISPFLHLFLPPSFSHFCTFFFSRCLLSIFSLVSPSFSPVPFLPPSPVLYLPFWVPLNQSFESVWAARPKWFSITAAC